MKIILKWILFFVCLLSGCECYGKRKKSIAHPITHSTTNESGNKSRKLKKTGSNGNAGELGNLENRSLNASKPPKKKDRVQSDSYKHNLDDPTKHTKDELAKQAKFAIVVLEVVNELRTEPLKFKIHLEALKKYFLANKMDETSYRINENLIFRTKEGIKAIDEAIAYLEQMPKNKPLKPLEYNQILDKSSLLHAKCMQKGKFFAHENEKNKRFYKPWDRLKQYCTRYTLCAENLWCGELDEKLTEKEQAVNLIMSLFIDDGVPTRGHRDNLLLNDATDLGIALWSYNEKKSVFVMNFGAGIVE